MDDMTACRVVPALEMVHACIAACGLAHFRPRSGRAHEARIWTIGESSSLVNVFQAIWIEGEVWCDSRPTEAVEAVSETMRLVLGHFPESFSAAAARVFTSFTSFQPAAFKIKYTQPRGVMFFELAPDDHLRKIIWDAARMYGPSVRDFSDDVATRFLVYSTFMEEAVAVRATWPRKSSSR